MAQKKDNRPSSPHKKINNQSENTESKKQTEPSEPAVRVGPVSKIVTVSKQEPVAELEPVSKPELTATAEKKFTSEPAQRLETGETTEPAQRLETGELTEPPQPGMPDKPAKKPLAGYIITGILLLVFLTLSAITLADYLKIGITETMIVYNGYRYEGETKNGNPVGNGTLVFSETEKHTSDNIGTIASEDFTIIAELADGIPNGKGFLIRIDGSIYAGDFKDGLMHGYGTFTWPDGSTYEGDYFENRKEGQGKVISANGLTYIGGFKSGVMHGEGLLISPHGMEREGVWVEGELQDES